MKILDSNIAVLFFFVPSKPKLISVQRKLFWQHNNTLQRWHQNGHGVISFWWY
ncbi:uncharacterized protein J3R85_000219 [Psidium guajava]|nr:uncharacterized protein J3R85_000219 [Psidium guajava]